MINIIRKLMIKAQVTISAVVMAFALISLPLAVSAQVAHGSSDFNHMKTGFPLTGVHTNVECETCHVGGIFKGTPTACAGCHSPGRNVAAPYKPANHIITNAACETCHTSTVSFLGARFNHIGVQPKGCTTCHNGVGIAPWKPAGHVLTIASCDSCHRSGSWIPAGFDHAGVVPGAGQCGNCHNGSTAIGKPGFHISTVAACDTCHHNFVTFLGAGFNHVGVVAGSCGTCHNGQSLEAKMQPTNHIPYTGNACDACHTQTAGYTTFVGPGASTTVIHNTIAATPCKTCHASGTNYLGVTGKKMSVTHKSSSATDCAQGGCHAPGGGTGISYVRWTN
jgi:hypothetical protein